MLIRAQTSPPFSDIIESFSKNVSAHARRLSIAQRQEFRLKCLTQPRNGDSVSPLEVAHSGVAPRFDDRDHRLVVFMKREGGLVRKQRPPQRNGWQTALTDSEIGSHHLSFGSRMRNATLALTHPSDR